MRPNSIKLKEFYKNFAAIGCNFENKIPILMSDIIEIDSI